MIVSVSKLDWCDVRSCLEITDYNLVLLRHLTSEFPNRKRVVCFIPVKDGRCRPLYNVDFDKPHTHCFRIYLDGACDCYGTNPSPDLPNIQICPPLSCQTSKSGAFCSRKYIRGICIIRQYHKEAEHGRFDALQ